MPKTKHYYFSDESGPINHQTPLIDQICPSELDETILSARTLIVTEDWTYEDAGRSEADLGNNLAQCPPGNRSRSPPLYVAATKAPL